MPITLKKPDTIKSAGKAKEKDEALLPSSAYEHIRHLHIASLNKDITIHEFIYPNRGKFKKAPGGWGKLPPDVEKTLVAMMEFEADVGSKSGSLAVAQSVKVIDKDHPNNVHVVDNNGPPVETFGSFACLQGNDMYSLPIYSGGNEKGALPGTIYGTGNHDPRYSDVGPIPDYKITGEGVKTGWYRTPLVGYLSDPPKAVHRDVLYLHIETKQNETVATTEGCAVTPAEFQKEYEGCIRTHQGSTFRILPSTTEGGLHYKDKWQNKQPSDHEKLNALAAQYHAASKTVHSPAVHHHRHHGLSHALAAVITDKASGR